MISNTLIGGEGPMGEGFSLIDDWHRDVCKGGPWADDGGSPRTPQVLHYCQGIPRADTWEEEEFPARLLIHKKHVPTSILSCKAPMLAREPENLRELDHH